MNKYKKARKKNFTEEEYLQIKIVSGGLYLLLPEIIIFIWCLLDKDHKIGLLLALGISLFILTGPYLDSIAGVISGGKYALKDTSGNPKIVWDLISEAFKEKSCSPNGKKSLLRVAKRITVIFWGFVYFLHSLIAITLVLGGSIYVAGGLLWISWNILTYLGFEGIALIVGVSFFLLSPIIFEIVHDYYKSKK